ncbi:MAG: hypothetical protein HY841_14705 [Bacteroidetes bacterium]|nr:hypothetical protein [Bacteroidota bacterium]
MEQNIFQSKSKQESKKALLKQPEDSDFISINSLEVAAEINSGDSGLGIISSNQNRSNSKYLYFTTKYFSADTLIKKENKTKNEGHKNIDKHRNTSKILVFSFVTALLLTGIFLTFLFDYALFFVLFGLTALVVALIYSSLRKLPDKDLPPKFDERKDTTKDNRKTPVVAMIGFSLGLLSCASLIFFFGVITIFSSLIGALFSVDAIQRIKNNKINYDGMGFAVAGFVLNIICMVFILYLLGYLAFYY